MINNRPLINYIRKNGNFQSHAQMAAELGVSHTHVSDLYGNKRKVSDRFIVRVMRYLGTPIATIDELLTAKDDGSTFKEPHPLFDKVLADYGLKTDRELCKRIGVHASVICEQRKGKIKVSADVVKKINQTFDMPVAEIRKLMGESHATPRATR